MHVCLSFNEHPPALEALSGWVELTDVVAPKAAVREESSDGGQPGVSAGVGAVQQKGGTPAAAAAAGKALEVTAAAAPLSGVAEKAVAGLIGPVVEAARGWGLRFGPELCGWATEGCTPVWGVAAAEGGASAGPFEGVTCCRLHSEGHRDNHLQQPCLDRGLHWMGDCAEGEEVCQQECSCSSWVTLRGANCRIPEVEADAVASAAAAAASAGLQWSSGLGA